MLQTYDDRPSLAAFNALASPFRLIKEAVLEEDSIRLIVDLSDVDWSKYAVVGVAYEPITRGSNIYCNLHNTLIATLTSFDETDGMHARVGTSAWLFPMHNPNFAGTFMGFGEKGIVYVPPTSNAALAEWRDTARAYINGTLSSGSAIRVYAIE